MTPKLKKRLVHLVAYPAFFLTAFAVLFLFSFPYEALKDRLQSEARQRNVALTIDALRPTLLGLEARGVQLHLFKAPDDKAAAEPLRIQTLAVFPHLFPLGAHVRAELLGGHLDAALHMVGGSKKFKLRARGLELARLPPEALGNIALDGTIALLADLALDLQDFAKTEGRVALFGTQLLLRKGSVQGFSLPRVDVGRLEFDVDLAGGKARLETARSTGVDLISTMEGEVRQARKVALSTPNVALRFQPSEAFLKRNTLVSAALGMAMQKDEEGFYEASIRGTLGKPKITPQKKPGKGRR